MCLVAGCFLLLLLAPRRPQGSNLCFITRHKSEAQALRDFYPTGKPCLNTSSGSVRFQFGFSSVSVQFQFGFSFFFLPNRFRTDFEPKSNRNRTEIEPITYSEPKSNRNRTEIEPIPNRFQTHYGRRVGAFWLGEGL